MRAHVGALHLDSKHTMSSRLSSSGGSALHLSRVEREMKAMKDSEETVLNLNYCNLREIPEKLLCCEYCKNNLHKLYLKRNCITTLVRK